VSPRGSALQIYVEREAQHRAAHRVRPLAEARTTRSSQSRVAMAEAMQVSREPGGIKVRSESSRESGSSRRPDA
jgi:hypothetical protein